MVIGIGSPIPEMIAVAYGVIHQLGVPPIGIHRVTGMFGTRMALEPDMIDGETKLIDIETPVEWQATDL